MSRRVRDVLLVAFLIAAAITIALAFRPAADLPLPAAPPVVSVSPR